MSAVLALHCALASGAAWRPLARCLPDWSWITPDLPGFGAAPDPGPTADLMAHALAVAEAALPAEPVHLIGHSYGGCVALAVWAAHPARLRSVTLVEPVMFAAAGGGASADHLRQMAPFNDALDAGDAMTAAQIFHGLWGVGPWAAVPPARQRAMADRIHLIRQSEPGIIADSHRILDRLPHAGPPLSVITRHDPPPIMAAIAAGLVDRRPAMTRVEIGDDHMVPVTAAPALAAHLRAVWAAP
ncbi:MAG: alpha/beta hydrolase [Pseudomonadota bacterium]